LEIDNERTTAGSFESPTRGKTVFLAGWMDAAATWGISSFSILRDHTGSDAGCLQSRKSAPKRTTGRTKFGPSTWWDVEGEVVLRSPETVNPQIATGNGGSQSANGFSS
jgi:aspartyl-tRNA synthetase